MARLRANHLLRIDAGDIAGAVQAHLPLDVIGVVDSQLDGHRNNSGLTGIQAVGRLNAGCSSLPHPGQEHIICGRDRHNHLVRVMANKYSVN